MAEQYSDPYEDWKAQGRPGGSFANWMADKNPPPAAPPQQPVSGGGGAPPTGAPAAPAQGDQSWTADNGAANKALQDAGGPSAVGLPPNPSQAQINAWFTEAVNAGGYTERGENTSKTAYNSSGYSAAGASDATGMRAYAKAHGMSEDFDRWSESQLRLWEKQKDSNCPPNAPYRSYEDGSCQEKPIDSNRGNYAEGGDSGGGGGGGRGGNGANGGTWTPPPPPKPVTFGNQLSMTGNPLQDMLIQQFNTGMDPTTYQNNIFALGEDMRVGGADANKDAQKSDRQAQSLSGGGLWWGQNKDTFGGFDASQKNAEGAATASPAAPKATATPAAPTIQASGATAGNGASRAGGAHVANPTARPTFGAAQNPTQITPISGMMANRFRLDRKPSYY